MSPVDGYHSVGILMISLEWPIYWWLYVCLAVKIDVILLGEGSADFPIELFDL
jgi:hypothetical protein